MGPLSRLHFSNDDKLSGIIDVYYHCIEFIKCCFLSIVFLLSLQMLVKVVVLIQLIRYMMKFTIFYAIWFVKFIEVKVQFLIFVIARKPDYGNQIKRDLFRN